MLVTIELSPAERASATPAPATVADAVKALRQHGCVLLAHAVSPELVTELRDEHFARNAPLLRGERPAGSGEVGGRRFMAPVEISGHFGRLEAFANPFALPVLRQVIGEEFVLGGCGTVTSLPGAVDQHIHRDGPPLFNKVVNRIVPPHAVNVFIPLIDFNAHTGTTRLFPGTHTNTDLEPATAPSVDPVIPVGTVLLMDVRLYHQGLANRSDLVRPLFYCYFQQPWFKDYKNHPSLPFLRISDDEYARLPPAARQLLAWTEHYRNGLY